MTNKEQFEQMLKEKIAFYETNIDSEDRAAMRVYLQRCEVRLSTMQRIATAFVSGAGLMVLVPIFSKDIMQKITNILLTNIKIAVTTNVSLFDFGLACILTVIFGFLFYVPIRALYLLFKDIIDFYFTTATPNLEIQNPTLALTGISLPMDEDHSGFARKAIAANQYLSSSINFMLPFSTETNPRFGKSAREKYFGDLKHIIPASRLEIRETLKQEFDDDLAANFDDKNLDYFDTAMAIGRSVTRTLSQEVAKTEMSLVRHILFLRRIILRYVKTLLIFVWTSIILFFTLAAWEVFPSLYTLILGATVCLAPMTYILHYPVEWIYRPLNLSAADFNEADHTDAQLVRIEEEIRKPWIVVSLLTAATGLLTLVHLLGWL